jgi:hypothetical protein
LFSRRRWMDETIGFDPSPIGAPRSGAIGGREDRERRRREATP